MLAMNSVSHRAVQFALHPGQVYALLLTGYTCPHHPVTFA
jgi:hypothetical protein